MRSSGSLRDVFLGGLVFCFVFFTYKVFRLDFNLVWLDINYLSWKLMQLFKKKNAKISIRIFFFLSVRTATDKDDCWCCCCYFVANNNVTSGVRIYSSNIKHFCPEQRILATWLHKDEFWSTEVKALLDLHAYLTSRARIL